MFKWFCNYNSALFPSYVTYRFRLNNGVVLAWATQSMSHVEQDMRTFVASENTSCFWWCSRCSVLSLNVVFIVLVYVCWNILYSLSIALSICYEFECLLGSFRFSFSSLINSWRWPYNLVVVSLSRYNPYICYTTPMLGRGLGFRLHV